MAEWKGAFKVEADKKPDSFGESGFQMFAVLSSRWFLKVGGALCS